MQYLVSLSCTEKFSEFRLYYFCELVCLWKKLNSTYFTSALVKLDGIYNRNWFYQQKPATSAFYLVRGLRTKFSGDTAVCDKSMKLSELHYSVTRNNFFNRDTLYSHVGTDVSIFLAPKCFLPNHVNLYTIGTAFQCWSTFS